MKKGGPRPSCLGYLGGGFKYSLCSSVFGEIIQFDSDFSGGLKPPASRVYILPSYMEIIL